MYLGFFYLGEICNPEGTSIAQSILQHQKDQDNYKTKMTRPHILNPTKTSRNLWDIFISHLTTDDINHHSPLKQLTDWHSKSGNWNTYISSNQRFIYTRKRNGKWDKFRHFRSVCHSNINPQLLKQNIPFQPAPYHWPASMEPCRDKYHGNIFHPLPTNSEYDLS